MNIFVIGYFGQNNLGDEAILESFLEWAQSEFDMPDFRVLTANSGETKKRHNVREVDKMNPLAIISAVQWCDVVVAPGGGLLQDATGIKNNLFYSFLLGAARLFGRRPVYMLSQGIGPINRKWSAKLVARAVGQCERMTVRDEMSLRLLDEIGADAAKVKKTADIVFLLGRDVQHKTTQDKLTGISEKSGKRILRIGVSLRPTDRLEHISGVIQGCALRLTEEYEVEPHLFVCDGDQDVAPMNRFAEDMRRSAPDMNVIIAGEMKGSPLSAREMIQYLCRIDVMIGMRLHSLVLSTLAGVPFVALPYDPKVTAFAKSCGQPLVPNPAHATPLEVTKMIKELMGDGRADSIRRLKELTSNNIEIVKSSLAGLSRTLKETGTSSTFNILGIPLCRLGFYGTLRKIMYAAQTQTKLHLVTVNTEIIMRARHDKECMELLTGDAVNTPDGVGPRITALLKYRRRIEPVTGIDLMTHLMEQSRRQGFRLFLIGAKPEVIEKVEKRLSEHPDRPLIAGVHHGYLKDVDPDVVIKKINDSRPHAVLVGMGFPLQERWIRDNKDKINASVFIGVGGSFDVLAGDVRRAPELLQKIGLEWMWRLLNDPARIARMKAFPAFILLAIADAFRGD